MARKLYSIGEIYMIVVKAFRSLPSYIKGMKTGLISEKFHERLMLAVTGVNKCAMCSYAHTEMALKAGLTPDEIRIFTEGDFPDLPEDEMKAVLFAQNYAENRGKPDRATWQEITSSYGDRKAGAILAVIRMIMLGNSMGIVMGSMSERLHGRKGDGRSSIPYEVAAILLLLPMMLMAIPHSAILAIFRKNLI